MPDHVEVRIAGGTIGLALEKSAREHHALEVSSSGNGAELVLWTTDLAESWEQMVAAGATPMALPEDLPNGLSVAWAADPDGNPVHLVMRRRD